MKLLPNQIEFCERKQNPLSKDNAKLKLIIEFREGGLKN